MSTEEPYTPTTDKEPPIWRDAWRSFQDPYLYPDAEKFPSPFESFVAGYMAGNREAVAAEIAKAQADALEAVAVEMIPDHAYNDSNRAEAQGDYLAQAYYEGLHDAWSAITARAAAIREGEKR